MGRCNRAARLRGRHRTLRGFRECKPDLLAALLPLDPPVASFAASTVDSAILNSPDPPGTEAGSALLQQLLSIARESALEEMASGMAHELNQPLGAVVTYAQAGERLLSRPEASLDKAREVLQPHGSGLGLSSARAIVEWHGGTIGFQPHGQRGSRFWFRLPASHAA